MGDPGAAFRRCAAAAPVTTDFLVGSLSVRDRRDHECRILDAYRQKLRLGADEDRVRFEADYALALIVRFAGVVGWLATTGSSAPTRREADLLAAALGDGRLVTALIDQDCDVLVQQR